MQGDHLGNLRYFKGYCISSLLLPSQSIRNVTAGNSTHHYPTVSLGGQFEHSTAQGPSLRRVSLGQNQSISRAMLLFEDSGKNSLPNSFRLSEFVSLWIEGRGPCFVVGCGSLSSSLGPPVFFATFLFLCQDSSIGPVLT